MELNLADEELTESPFQFIFPNIAMGVQADGCILFDGFDVSGINSLSLPLDSSN